jgi:hypothetical protein
MTSYGLDDREARVQILVRSGIFPSSGPFMLAVGLTQPPIHWVLGALCPEVKQLGHEADHSPPIIAEVKKLWINTSTPPCVIMTAINLLSTGIALHFAFN